MIPEKSGTLDIPQVRYQGEIIQRGHHKIILVILAIFFKNGDEEYLVQVQRNQLKLSRCRQVYRTGGCRQTNL